MRTDADGYQESLDQLLLRVRACRVCAGHLPLGPRPIVRASKTARLLIVGQAPGTSVHATGIPWNDASGNRLRQWLAMPAERFYDESRVAIMPMGLCYPGRSPDRGGDLPPRPECAPLWHARLREHQPAIRLTLLVGRYAQIHYLPQICPPTLTETVARWRDFLWRGLLPLPHPSWRTTGWQRDNPWFDDELLPCLRRHLAGLFPSGLP